MGGAARVHVMRHSFPGLEFFSYGLVNMECLQAGRQRVVYLITYSRADVVKFPSKESFSNAVLQAWQNFGVRVVQWVMCIEAHHNTDNGEHEQNMNLYHYHMAIKLEKRVRWFQVRKYLEENFGIKVNFSDNHPTYYSAYRYMTKEDNDALHSPSHPHLTDVPPQTESAVATKKRKAKAKLTAAKQLLQRHEIEERSFCNAIYNALEKGRGKYRNVYIHGPANCGKSFIVSPLKVIYQVFSNPATGSFAWIGAEEAEFIYLNDFRWHPKIIAWPEFLQALEGDTVHLPVPKNFCSKDIELSKDTPFFATSDAPLVLVKGGAMDHVNTEMMNCRWVFFPFLEANTTCRTGGYPPHVDFASQNLFCLTCVTHVTPVDLA